MIIIHPFSAKLGSGKKNPKDYPYWKELIAMIDEPIVQIGIEGEEQLVPDFRKNLTFPELSELLKECRLWIGVDSFFQHLAWYENKPGIVLWGRGDPKIFGHKENINILKNSDNIRKNIFDIWDTVEFDASVFVSPEGVASFLSDPLFYP